MTALTGVPYPDDPLLDYREVSALTGYREQTLRAYLSRGLMPRPDARFGQSPAWRRSTILRWERRKPE